MGSPTKPPDNQRPRRAAPKKKKKHPLKRGRLSWGLHMKRKKQDLAARMIQRLFRSYRARCQFIESRYRVRMAMSRVKQHHVLFDRAYWQRVNLHAMRRTELESLALRLELPGLAGKKGQIIKSIQHWIDLRMHVHDVAVEAAMRANDKKLQAQGCVYVLGASPGSRPATLRPLSGRSISVVAAGFESEAVYAVDAGKGMVWLCRTSGLASQVGYCSTLRDQDVFDEPYAAKWLVTPVPMQTLRMAHIKELNVGHTHVAARASTGEMYTWGTNPYGQLGLDHKVHGRQLPFVVGVTETYTTVAMGVGTQHSLAVCDNVKEQDGVLFAWGGNAHGQLGLEACEPSFAPQRVVALQGINVRKVACGAMHSVVATNLGEVYAWGCGDGGRLGITDTMAVSAPRRIESFVPPLHCAIAVACGAWHSAAILSDSPCASAGMVFTWGTGVYGQLGLGSAQVALVPQVVPLPPMKALGDPFELVQSVACGTQHMAALTVVGNVYTWGSKDAFSPLPRVVPSKERSKGRISSIACGASFTVFCTLPMDETTYEAPQRHLLWSTTRSQVPKIDLSSVPQALSLLAAVNVIPRLQPEAERYQQDQAAQDEDDRIEAMDLETWLHPRCRLCWHCPGFQITLTKMKLCRLCKHNREFHGPRDGPMTQYEAVRKVQSKWRQRQGIKYFHNLFLERVQRVFSIRHNQFFYYNTCNKAKTWLRPSLLPTHLDFPIRDPDDQYIRPPYTRDDAASVIAALYRGWKARKVVHERIRARFERCTDRTGRVFYRDRRTNATRWDLPLEKRMHHGHTKAKTPTTQDAAVLTLQRWWRGVLVRLNVEALVRRIYRALLDPATGNTYYYNTRTKQVTWTRPRWLKEVRQRKRRHVFTEEAAAETLQRMYRGRLARRLLRQLLQKRFHKVWDPAAEKFYFIDGETGTAAPDVPKLGIGFDQVVPLHRKRRKKRVLTPDMAALLVQKAYRVRQARRAAAQRANRLIEQIWDPVSQAYFYHNKQTHAVSWVKPQFWVDRTSTATLASQGNATTDDKEKPQNANTVNDSATSLLQLTKSRRREYMITDENEAALLVQTQYRRRHASQQCKAVLLARFQRVLDPNTQRYFYYDKETSTSQWSAPKILQELIKSPVRPRASQENAAVRIQGIFRLRRARREAVALAQSNYEKVYDGTIGAYYYFNTKTGESQWTKPKCFHNADATVHVDVHGQLVPTSLADDNTAVQPI
ncbi:hypothetical protein ACHHYP_07422 [Achlya hypogyna]|uniref:WW domain-containing protein n=1 Tax=Achlya hypogyna TaxID=1202772 RepID=A0A1V9ZMI8_ACHHY|nr:hypothetical protein ACHHYP_07422 [Achlya hypogyna]